MKGNCSNCGTKEHHAWKVSSGIEICGDCTYVSASFMPGHIKKQQRDHAKDIIQPMKYDKQEKAMVPNSDFAKIYGKNKAQAFSDTIQTEQKRQRANVPLSQAVKSVPVVPGQ